MAYDIQQLLGMTQAQLDELMRTRGRLARMRAKFIEPMLLLRTEKLPEGGNWLTRSNSTATEPSHTRPPEIAGFINHFAWQGKIFDAKAGLLKNKILPLGLAAIVAQVYKGESWFDGKECIVLDYSQTSLVAGWIRDEIRMIQPRFYLGEVFGGKTRIFHFSLQF